MKKLFSLFVAIAALALPAIAQLTQPNPVGQKSLFCWAPSISSYVMVNAGTLASGQSQLPNAPPAATAYGYNSGGQYSALECDSSGNLILAPGSSQSVGTLTVNQYLPGTYSAAMPAAFALLWDNTRLPLAVTLNDVPGMGREVGSAGLTPYQVFNTYSTAYSAPGATYYVNFGGASSPWGAGSDSNAGTSMAAPFQHWSKAITAANTAAVPTKVIVLAVLSSRLAAFFSAVTPTVDMAFVITGGRMILGTFDQFSAPSLDGTYTNCYDLTVSSSVSKVMDMLNTDQFGDYKDLTQVSTASIANNTPGSYAFVSTTLYIHRADGLAVTDLNTRLYRSASDSLFFAGDTHSLYIGPASGDNFSGIDCEAGSGGGCFDQANTSPGSTKAATVLNNLTFKYAGDAVTNTAGNGVRVDSLNGVVAIFNSHSSHNIADCFNFHDTYASGAMLVLTVNDTCVNTGFYPSTSNNGWTTHDDVAGVDIAGYYRISAGGTVKSINASNSWLVGTFSQNDRGDINLGGTTTPAAFMIQNTANYWCDRCRADIYGAAYAFENTGTGTMYLHNAWSSGANEAGTIVHY